MEIVCAHSETGDTICHHCASQVLRISAVAEVSTLRQQLSEVERERDEWIEECRSFDLKWHKEYQLARKAEARCREIWERCEDIIISVSKTSDDKSWINTDVLLNDIRAEAEKEAIWQWVEDAVNNEYRNDPYRELNEEYNRGVDNALIALRAEKEKS